MVVIYIYNINLFIFNKYGIKVTNASNSTIQLGATPLDAKEFANNRNKLNIFFAWSHTAVSHSHFKLTECFP